MIAAVCLAVAITLRLPAFSPQAGQAGSSQSSTGQSQSNQGQSQTSPMIKQSLSSLDGGPSKCLYLCYVNPLPEPKISPLAYGTPPKQHSFSYVTSGYANTAGSKGSFNLRFRVFSEDAQTNQTLGVSVCRELLRLWELNFERLRIDHSPLYHTGIVDVYLAKDGTPGGEQRFGIDHEGGMTIKCDTIYIYALSSFTDPLEEAREVAHEYGHASLPAIGGYTKPEYWANGYLGEKLFLRWLNEEMHEDKISPDDAMGASMADLGAWAIRNVDQIESEAAQSGPDNPLLKGFDAKAMSAFHGIVMYCDSIMPPLMAGRSLELLTSEKADAYVASAVLASEEKSWQPKFPKYLLGKKVWIPVGSGKLKGGKSLAKSRGWVQVVAVDGLTVVQPDPSD